MTQTEAPAINPFGKYIYLVLFYLIPRDRLTSRYEDFPREPQRFINSYKWTGRYNSTRFQNYIKEVWGNQIWRHLGIPAPRRSFSKDDPIYILVHDIRLWALILNDYMGFTVSSFQNFPDDFPYPYVDSELFEDFAYRIASVFIENSTFLDMVKTVHEHRDFSDFNPNYITNYQRDFYRRYYHTRSKYAKLTPLEQAQNRKTGNIKGERVDDSLVTLAWIHEFFDSLADTDRKIASWLYDGYTQEEIAWALGYKNNSAVSKRLKSIRQKLREYMG